MNIFQGDMSIVGVEEIASNIKKFLFQINNYQSLDGKIKKSQKLNYKAGQFISIKFTDKIWRAYSIASIESEEFIELIIRIVPNGIGSMILDQAKIGDTFKFKGPFGHFNLSDNKTHKDKNLIFLCTGTGIAPFRSMILEEMKHEYPREMKLFYGGKNSRDLAYLNDFSNWAPAKKLKVRLALSRDKKAQEFANFAEHCRITKFLEEDDFDENSEFYICGNGAMVKSVQDILSAKNVDKSRIFMERFN